MQLKGHHTETGGALSSAGGCPTRCYDAADIPEGTDLTADRSHRSPRSHRIHLPRMRIHPPLG
eukprot:9490875-Pyramimonas_sp.AAC.1